ncbi:MAG TPA: hypothetical protein VF033_02180 [Steroidobacteraceae bacterium]|jgi:hypothetical protein
MKSLGVLLVCFCGVAWAADGTEKIPAELRSCVGIERNTERLACFDRGVAALLGAEGAAAPSAESSFGLVATTPRADAIRDVEGEDLRKVVARVTAVTAANDGSSVVTLDNGQVWRQISGGMMLLKVGDEVTINRAALGSFQMLVPSGRNGKVKRVR